MTGLEATPIFKVFQLKCEDALIEKALERAIEGSPKEGEEREIEANEIMTVISKRPNKDMEIGNLIKNGSTVLIDWHHPSQTERKPVWRWKPKNLYTSVPSKFWSSSMIKTENLKPISETAKPSDRISFQPLLDETSTHQPLAIPNAFPQNSGSRNSKIPAILAKNEQEMHAVKQIANNPTITSYFKSETLVQATRSSSKPNSRPAPSFVRASGIENDRSELDQPQSLSLVIVPNSQMEVVEPFSNRIEKPNIRSSSRPPSQYEVQDGKKSSRKSLDEEDSGEECCDIQMVGLKNLGNTCYINSVIQSIIRMKLVQEWYREKLLQSRFFSIVEANEEHFVREMKKKDSSFLYQFILLMKKMHKKNRRGYVDPQGVKTALDKSSEIVDKIQAVFWLRPTRCPRVSTFRFEQTE